MLNGAFSSSHSMVSSKRVRVRARVRVRVGIAVTSAAASLAAAALSVSDERELFAEAIPRDPQPRLHERLERLELALHEGGLGLVLYRLSNVFRGLQVAARAAASASAACCLTSACFCCFRTAPVS